MAELPYKVNEYLNAQQSLSLDPLFLRSPHIFEIDITLLALILSDSEITLLPLCKILIGA